MLLPDRKSFKVIYFYLIVGVLLYFGVNARKVAEHAWPKTLSRLRVNYSYLVEAAGGAVPGHAQFIDGKRYFNAIASVYGERSDTDAFLGMSLYYLGDRKAAREIFIRLSDREPGFFWAQYNLAVLAYLDKEYPLAVDYCQKAMQLSAQPSVTFMMTSKVYQPLFMENGITPSVLAKDIEQAKVQLLQIVIAIRSGNTARFTFSLPIRVF